MITQERLKHLLSYDMETGVFRRRKVSGRRGPIREGQIAGDAGGGKRKQYWRISVDGTRHYAHQLAWFYVYGKWPEQVDHKDRNGHNNAISNLRVCTQGQNNINSKRTVASGFRGVHVRAKNLKKPFIARIKVNGEKLHLGYFETAEDAHYAYVEAAVKHYGEFADVHLRAIGTANEEARG